MGQVRTLIDIIENLASFSHEDTIYACEPWTENSNAMVALEPDEGGVPPEAASAGMTYFLEIFIATEVIEGCVKALGEGRSTSWLCQKVIYYATYDAYGDP
jgi:hypothetical protein